MEEFSFEKASKFKDGDRFFDINYVWSPGYKKVIEKLYYTSTRPEAVVGLSLVAGLLSAYLYSFGEYHFSLIAAFLIWVKNYLDTVDGHLARAKGQVSRLGRFLDSLSDAVVYLALFAGIAFNLSRGNNFKSTLFLSYFVMLTAFIQCSFYNYYVVSYKICLMGKGVNRTDESFSEEEKRQYRDGFIGLAVFILQCIYQVVYGWQDKLVTAIDKKAYKIFLNKNKGLTTEESEKAWYADKRFIAFTGPLSFGTQILALVIFSLFDNIDGFLYFIALAGSAYTVIFFILKVNQNPKKD